MTLHVADAHCEVLGAIMGEHDCGPDQSESAQLLEEIPCLPVASCGLPLNNNIGSGFCEINPVHSASAQLCKPCGPERPTDCQSEVWSTQYRSCSTSGCSRWSMVQQGCSRSQFTSQSSCSPCTHRAAAFHVSSGQSTHAWACS